MKKKNEKSVLTRGRLELLCIILMLVCSLSIFTVLMTTKTTLIYDNGQITYTGYIRNSRMNGNGKLTYQNGDTYEGDFVNGVFEGQGTFVSSSGWSYTGSFKNGVPDGQGTLKAKDSNVYTGNFKQGIYQK